MEQNTNQTDQNTNIMKQFVKLSMLMHRAQHMGSRGAGRGRSFQNPHRGQGRILSALKMQPEISQRELSYLLDMSNQALSELLGKLEKSGFVTREQSEADRRVMNIKLTEAGAAAAKETDMQKRDVEELFDCLTDDEKENLASSLNKIISEFEGLMGEMKECDGFGERMGDPREGLTPEMIEKMRKCGFHPHMFERRGKHGRGFGRRGREEFSPDKDGLGKECRHGHHGGHCHEDSRHND